MEKIYTRDELDKIMYDYIKESAEQIKKEINLYNKKDLSNKTVVYA